MALSGSISSSTAEYHCRSGKRCLGRTKDGPAITAKFDTICAACIQDIQRQIDELPHLAVALRAFLGVTPKTALQSRVKSTPEPACPLDPRVDELLTDIEDVIDRTDGLRVADLVQQPAMKFIVWFKDDRRETYLTGIDRALAIRRVYARANAILGFDRIWVKRHAPCPQCGLPTLGAFIGSSNIECRDCAFVLSLDEYSQYLLELAG
jgi:hypothetical protein